MSDTGQLAFLRKYYLKLSELLFVEIQKGRTMQDLTEIRTLMEEVMQEMQRLERESDKPPN